MIKEYLKKQLKKTNKKQPKKLLVWQIKLAVQKLRREVGKFENTTIALRSGGGRGIGRKPYDEH